MLIAKNQKREIFLNPSMANRHGLISGATGTGKTVTLKVLAENFSSLGVAVFLSDVKGDLSGFAKNGESSPKFEERLEKIGVKTIAFESFPTVFWDLWGQNGHPIKTTVSQMGPILLSRLLNLNETQSQILTIVFKIADDNGLLLLDTKDLKAILSHVGQNAQEFKNDYGNISAASLGAIQRGVIALEEAGGDRFFGEPSLNIDDLLQTEGGKGVINILDARKLVHSSELYSTFLLWLLAELFENLPEVGDVEKPKFVFFFDEAHLLFDSAPKILLQKIEQTVRLIRSKGVGIYFVTQSPSDIPDDVLGQLGNKFVHALRAYTEKDAKALKAVAQGFRPNPKLNALEALGELGVGEALVSTLDENATPTPVERAYIMPPKSSFKPIDDGQIGQIVKNSPLYGFYEKTLDRESAYELLTGKISKQTNSASQTAKPEKGDQDKFTDGLLDVAGTLAKSAARAIGSQIGREILRGILGAVIGSKRR